MRANITFVVELDATTQEAAEREIRWTLKMMESGGGKFPSNLSCEIVRDGNEPKDLGGCECDNTHQAVNTVCRWCWARGRRQWNDPER